MDFETQCNRCGTFIDDWRFAHFIYPHLCTTCGNLKELATKNRKQNEEK